MMSLPGLRLRGVRPDAERWEERMHDRSPVEFHKEVISFRKQESKLKKLLSSPRRKLDQDQLIENLRDVRGEIARLQSELHKS